MQMWRWAIKRRLWGLLMVALLSGCHLMPCQSSYRVEVPLLSAEPLQTQCSQGPCVILRRADYQAIVRELKAACLSTGQSMEECQAK
jgi:hypothetical protein